MFKTVLALALLMVVKVLATPHSRPNSLYEDQRVIRQEAACAVQGGMCRERDDCNTSDIVRVADLCPLQSNFGVVCCYYARCLTTTHLMLSDGVVEDGKVHLAWNGTGSQVRLPEHIVRCLAAALQYLKSTDNIKI